MHVSKRTALGAAAIAAVAFAIPALAKPTAPTEPATCGSTDVTLSISQNMLWPPNHKFVPITITATDADGDGDSAMVSIGQITNSDEDPATNLDGNGTGKPDVTPYEDEQGSNQAPQTINDNSSGPTSVTFDISLAAERSGHDNGSGRTYSIPVTCSEMGGTTDETSMMPSTSTLTVFVPHDQGNHNG